jgi:hypothetical protein
MSAIVIRRFELPPVPVLDGAQLADWSTAGTASAGKVTGEVLRFDYYDPFDGVDYVESTFEVRIDGLPDACGMSAVLAEHPEVLEDLSAVCIATAAILRECL